MGAWGVDVFQNDDALDWVCELEETKDAALLVKTLETAARRGNAYLDAFDCSRGLAAAEVVVALGGGATPGLPEECKAWVARRRDQWAMQLPALTLSAIERIRTNSELKDLWAASDHANEWYDVLSNLERRLRAISGQVER